MNDAPRLEELIGLPDIRCVAFDAQGARVVAMPFEVDEARLLSAVGPLDVVEPSAQGTAVIAFEHARRTGHGAGRVSLLDDDRSWWLDVFDRLPEHGCFVAVLTPVDPTAPLDRPTTAFVPRRGSFTMDVTGVVLSVSPAMTQMLGWRPEDLVGQSSLRLVHPDEQEAGIYAWADLLDGVGGSTRLRQRLARKDGGWLWVESTELNLLDDTLHPRIESEFIDISREVAAEAELQRRETVLDRLYRALPSGVAVLDPDGSVAAVNDRWAELVGATEGGPIEMLISRVSDPRSVVAAVAGAVRDGVDVDLELDLDDTSQCRHVALRIRPLVESGHHVGLLFTLDDTTDRRVHERLLAEQMRRDPLTGALNRLGVEEVLVDRLPSGVELGVLYLDLDRFKQVNDAGGHATGDRLLRAVVEAVDAELDPDDILGRIGGDEFLVVLARPSDLDDVGGRIRRRVAALEQLTGQPVAVSIGGTSARPGDDLDQLIGRADAAMYRDKAERREQAGRDRRRQPATSD